MAPHRPNRCSGCLAVTLIAAGNREQGLHPSASAPPPPHGLLSDHSAPRVLGDSVCLPRGCEHLRGAQTVSFLLRPQHLAWPLQASLSSERKFGGCASALL